MAPPLSLKPQLVQAPRSLMIRTRFLSASLLVALAVVAALCVLAVLPLLALLREAVTDSGGRLVFANFVRVVSNSFNVEAIRNSVVLSAFVAGFSVVFGCIFAFYLTRVAAPLKNLLRATSLLSIVSPGFLIAFAYILLMGPNAGYINALIRALVDQGASTGPLNIYSSAGFVLLGTPMGIGICTLQFVPAFANTDSSLEEASRIAGAGSVGTLFGITLPLVVPTLLSGLVLTFVLSLSFFGIPQILGLNVLSVAIRQSLLVSDDFKGAAALSIIVTAISLVAIVFYRWAHTAQKKYSTVGTRGAANRVMDIGLWKYLFIVLVVLYALVSLVLPYATLLYVSLLQRLTDTLTLSNLTFAHYANLFTSDFTRLAIINSAWLSIASALVVMGVGLCAGYVMTRTQSRLRSIIDYAALLPLGLAGTAFGAAVLLTYLDPPLNRLALPGTLTIMGLAYVGHFVSFGVRSAEDGLSQIAPELDEAARVAGSSKPGAFLSIDVPLLRQSLLSTGILVFILCFPELSISIMLESVDTQVVATALLGRWEGAGGLQGAAAMAVLVFGMTAILLLGVYVAGAREKSRRPWKLAEV